jgi:glycosyltransferase involved in cell wall biosynthesis
MKILHLISEVGDGGDWTFLKCLAQCQAEKHDVHIFGQWVSCVSSQFDADNVHLHELRRWSLAKGFIVELLDFVKHARGGSQYTIIHCHSLQALFVAIALKIFHRTPIVFTMHLTTPQSRFKTLLKGILLKCANIVVAPSVETQEVLTLGYGMRIEDVCVIGCGVSEAAFYPADDLTRMESRQRFAISTEGTCVLGFAGRLNPEKRVFWLIEYVAHAVRRGFDIIAVIAGRGPDADALKSLALQMDGGGKRVIFCGKVADMREFYIGCDVVVLPSLHETFGLSTAEAMMCGVPIIRSRTEGYQSQIIEGKTGFGFNVDDKDDFFRKLDQLVEDRCLRERMRANAAVHAQKSFTLTSCVNRYDEVYQRARRVE